MRIVSLLVLVSFGFMAPAFAKKVTLDLPDKLVNVVANKAPVLDTVKKLLDEHGVKFNFAAGADGTKEVSVDLKNVKLRTALTTILEEAGLTFNVDDKGVVQIKRQSVAQ